ncbi:MAG: M28 family peptidase [Chitinophagales bacterium]|nr:M28 family peptidase [Chitinophagales bacterium]
MNKKSSFIIILLLATCTFTQTSCKWIKKNNAATNEEAEKIERPPFVADSAYSYISDQVAFGPRVPGTEAQKKCVDYLKQKLVQFGAQVQIQEGTVTVFDGTQKPMYNIIGSINPQIERRLLLMAHWDSRPFADQGTIDSDKPIDAANDGASGVGVLLEIARQLQLKKPEIGIDILFVDVEDYGKPEVENSYALGTQFWAKQAKNSGYMASNGILLDMVGAGDAYFTFEGYSVQYAGDFLKMVWGIAHQLGHGSYFSYTPTDMITDDHYYVNTIAGIPTIDIIHRDMSSPTGFWKHWHTQEDKLDKIDKKTLQVVGETVLATIYAY